MPQNFSSIFIKKKYIYSFWKITNNIKNLTFTVAQITFYPILGKSKFKMKTADCADDIHAEAFVGSPMLGGVTYLMTSLERLERRGSNLGGPH